MYYLLLFLNIEKYYIKSFNKVSFRVKYINVYLKKLAEKYDAINILIRR